MLLAKPSFLLRYAVRNYINLLNPKINRKEDVILPKQALVHYIDPNEHVRFPTKDLYYFKDTPSSKKIRVQTVTDLAVKEGNPILKDKLIANTIRQWYRANLSVFRPSEITQTPVLDDTTVSVINYNAVKDAYRYTSSPLSKYYAYTNLHATYLKSVKEIVTTHPSVVNFVPFYIPTMLYGYNVIKRISEFPPQKMMRLVQEDALLNVIHLFLWLDPKTRNQSVYKDLTDEDSANVVLAIEYKDHVVYLPLSILASLSDASGLQSKLKKPVDKVQKMYVIFLLIIQSRVDKLLEAAQVDTPVAKGVTPDHDFVEAEDTSSEQDIDIDELEKEYSDTDMDTLFAKDELDADAPVPVVSEPTPEQEEISFTATDTEIIDLIQEKPLDDQFSDYLGSLLDVKAVNSSELRAVKKLIESRKTLKSPYDPTKLFNEARIVSQSDREVTLHDRTIDVHNDLVRADMQQDILKVMDNKYIDSVLKKDVLACVSNIEKAGVVIKSYEIEEEKSKLGNYEIHRLVLKPLLGKESTIYFKLPKVNDEGEFLASGVKVKLRKVKTSLPIVKIAPNRVALTSNYSKLFITRSEKKAYDYYTYLTDYIRKSYIEDTEHVVKILSLSLGNTFQNKEHLPNIYAAMSMVFSRVKVQTLTGEYTFVFSQVETLKLITPELNAEITQHPEGFVFCGFDKSNTPIVVDKSDTFYLYGKVNYPPRSPTSRCLVKICP